ncbi:scramblase family protein [Aspergillus ibericus CBS 121593]|uniref:Scramblase-domain-containing protein n=1 Tax=Aspergillus ibericus CBS 121593 TaxID=1448316 RepID=A0A395H3F9_9EURO|nr:Scramblase-domain-containing protein [Aspergillus ibericus CBS 121593]RAL01969.1 Scramblase-domain-containing protein [Aspergillus ibericus CBS 121593]
MWSTTLRTPAQCLRAPGRALASSFRGRSSPRGPRNSIRRPEPIRKEINPSPAQSPQSHNSEIPETPETTEAASNSLVSQYDPSQNTLLAPVHIPEDPNGVIKETHPATGILANSGLVVQRQLELMNVMIGFEQANKYIIMDANGNHIGYMAEQESGMANMMARQSFRTHRSFVTHVFDRHENEVLRFHRPFAWINSRIRVYDPLDVATGVHSSSTAHQTNSVGSLAQPTGDSKARVSSLNLEDMRVIGEAQQQWAPLRRKYNLCTYHPSPNPATDMKTEPLPLSQMNLSKSQQMQLVPSSQSDQDKGAYNQFAYVDEPFLSWDFGLRTANSQLIGSVNRNFAGFAREIFTDTGVYALRMDSVANAPSGSSEEFLDKSNTAGMTFDQRAVMLATAVSIDFDYFSRHSNSGGLGFMPLWIPGFGGEAAAGGAAAGGMADGVAAGAAGAGAMAGYDALSRGMGHQPAPDQQSPPAEQQPPASDQTGPYGDVWGEEPEQSGAQEESPWADEVDEGEGGGDDFDWF